ncbi:MAG: adenylate/guanylate cyclase domain-containing protein [Verrucomicrobia bacterium]|nr:adenylate/guanylate cyclase domain-containing protein [Verrucomicrobiota bacterium]
MGSSLRAKIMSGVLALLVLFASALAVTLYLIRDSSMELMAIDQYHLRLNKMVSDLDVYTFELEIIAYELSASSPPGREHGQKRQERAHEVKRIIDQIFSEAIPLAEKGSEDNRNDIEDRLGIAKLIGSLRTLEVGTRGFVDAAIRSIDLAIDGKAAEARRALEEVQKYEDLDPVYTRIRNKTADLTAKSLVETNQNIQNIIRANLTLFASAGVLGLLVFLVITGRLQTAFRRLTAAFRQTAEGEIADPLPVTSKDEIGDLTHSFNQMVEQLKSKERLREAFGQFLDPRIVANVVDATTGQLKEVAERRKVTIFFCDIANFSGIGEQLTAANLVRLLNRYFTASTEAIRAHRGIVDKFIGDAVMAFWASPFSPGETHARDGCLACLDLVKSFHQLGREISEITGLRRNVPKFHTRMALATGDTVIGTVGSDTTKSFTVIGDTVNIASRLEGVSKIYGTTILINEECYRLAEPEVEAREIDLITVFGKVEPVRIYELQGRQGSLDPALAKLNNVYADALQLYREQRWKEAEAAFRECLRIKEQDGPSLEFLTRIANFARTPPPKDWSGIWNTASK